MLRKNIEWRSRSGELKEKTATSKYVEEGRGKVDTFVSEDAIENISTVKLMIAVKPRDEALFGEVFGKTSIADKQGRA